MANTDVDRRLQVLEDKDALASLLNKYCRSADTRDTQPHGECFTEDAEFHGPWGVVKGRDEIASLAASRHTGEHSMQHSMTNMEFVINDDGTASGTASLFFAGIPDVAQPERHRTRGGHYTFQFVKTPDGWQIDWERLDVLWTNDATGS